MNTEIARGPFRVVWVALILATLVSWWLGTSHGLDDVRIASVLILLVAFFKVTAVGLYFMELREAPVALKAIFLGWCVTVCAVLVMMYLLG